jgi:two-component system sensor histidine kinase/response regulator
LLRDTLKPLGLRCEEKGLELILERCTERTGAGSMVTRADLRQILTNLYWATPSNLPSSGSVILQGDGQKCWIDDGTTRSAFRGLRYRVSGFPKTSRTPFSRPFSQADSSVSRRFGGTGLGLTICVNLVKFDGLAGPLGRERRRAQGSRFNFTMVMPACRRVCPGRSCAASSVLQGCRALVVDDVAATHSAFWRPSLMRRGALVTSVESGEAALAALQAGAQRGEPYRLLLLDSAMPGLSGFDVAAALQRGETPPIGTVMMISAAGLRGDAQRCRELGVVAAYLIKPLLEDELRRG